MLVTMKRKDFEALNDSSLIWTCIEPTIQQIRGKNFTIKSEAYALLNPGQRALLMVQILIGHTSSYGVEEFYSHQAYLLANRGVWSQLKKGMQYFEDNDMLQILEKMDSVYQSLTDAELNANEGQNNVQITGVSNNNDLSAIIRLLDKSLSDTLPVTIKRVAAYIRKNVDEFLQLTDEY